MDVETLPVRIRGAAVVKCTPAIAGSYKSERDPQAEQPSLRPGRARTWWHPLLTRLLSWLLQDGYDVEPELPVGEMPLRIDALLARRESGEISPWAERNLPELIPCLRARTLIELKGPTDALEAGDWDLLTGYAMLYLQQQGASLTLDDVSLVFIAPSLSQPFLNHLPLRRLHVESDPNELGVYRIVGGMFETWVIETDEMARRRRPILTLFSRVFLRDRRRIIEELEALGCERVLRYVVQQIQQFRQFGENWTMQFSDTAEMEKIDEELREALLSSIRPAELERILQRVPPQERLKGLSPEQVLQGLSPEQVLQGLSADERRRLKELLDREEEIPPSN
jgi:hypothetical protein